LGSHDRLLFVVPARSPRGLAGLCAARLSLALLALLAPGLGVAACGPEASKEPVVPATASSADAGGADGGADAAPAERPFAGSPGEATQLISAAIEKRTAEVSKCVTDYRARKKMPHQRVELSVGIDQEGRLLGAALKGTKQQDTTLSECVTRSLAGLPFPRSHAGVIQITKSYEEIAQ
jgi:hypothetical protein